jgi:hypothetical protein
LPSTIEQLHLEYRARGLAVLAVNMEEPPETVAAWVRNKRVSMDILLDPPRRGLARVGHHGHAVGLPRRSRRSRRGPRRRHPPMTDPDGRAVIEALLRK